MKKLFLLGVLMALLSFMTLALPTVFNPFTQKLDYYGVDNRTEFNMSNVTVSKICFFGSGCINSSISGGDASDRMLNSTVYALVSERMLNATVYSLVGGRVLNSTLTELNTTVYSLNTTVYSLVGERVLNATFSNLNTTVYSINTTVNSLISERVLNTTLSNYMQNTTTYTAIGARVLNSSLNTYLCMNATGSLIIGAGAGGSYGCP